MQDAVLGLGQEVINKSDKVSELVEAQLGKIATKQLYA